MSDNTAPQIAQAPDDETTKYEKIEKALLAKLTTHKDAEFRQLMLGYVVPLLKAAREETIDAFDALQERLEDVEEDTLNGKALKLVEKAKDTLLACGQLIDNLMAKHEYIINGAFAEKVDDGMKTQIGAVQAATADWFRAYADFSADEDDDDDEDDGDEQDAQGAA